MAEKGVPSPNNVMIDEESDEPQVKRTGNYFEAQFITTSNRGNHQ